LSRGFSTKDLPIHVLKGIESAFKTWEDMTGDWLQSAPEYLVTVHIAEQLRRAIPPEKRKIWIEPSVQHVLKTAGGVQRGPKRAVLRVRGRCDIVLGHGSGIPRTVIEVKNPIWQPKSQHPVADLHRICSALLYKKDYTQLYSGVLAIFTSAAPPKIKKDATAKDYLLRKWDTEWRSYLKSWSWAGPHATAYDQRLRIDVHVKIHEREFDDGKHAWAAICVAVARNKQNKNRDRS
jgi:hypothetical protein